ncbi:MAG: hypothetical protein ACKVT2_16975 [Saprospiraceae bacterium]
MTQLLINKLRGLAGSFALLVGFLVLGSVDASAQTASAAPAVNPETSIAQYLGVNACVLGTATNVQGGIASLDAQMIALKASNPSSMYDKLRLNYYQAVIRDVRDYDIYPEIALLSNLKFAPRVTGGNPSVQQFAGLYNTTKVLFGMCQ